MVYDVIVVGKGLVGSAAAKHLSKGGLKVLLVGPGEPKNKDQALVFASHYDEARIQRQIGFDPMWTQFHLDSIAAYKEMEAETGIRFFYPTGCLYICPHGVDEYLETAANEAAKNKVSYQMIEGGRALKVRFPEFDFADEAIGYYEEAPSGYINPRALVKAQCQLFEKAGGTILPDTITQIENTGNHYTLTTATGKTIYSERVLVAAGSFVNWNNLLPQKLDITVKGETVIFARLSPNEARRLAHIPSLLYEIVTEELDGIYMLPHITYPDGHTYIKMGMNMKEDLYFTTLAEAQNWFRQSPNPALLSKLKAALLAYMPNLKAEAWHIENCIITRTPNRIPYLHNLDNAGLFVACTCNGYTAMSAEGIGKIAAKMIF